MGLVRYDAAIIGAGGEGLAAAIVLAKAGLSALVVDRAAAPGGRLVTRSFHPGFSAGPYGDDVAEIPPALFHELGLAAAGLAMAPAPASLALWPGRRHVIGRDAGDGAAALLHEAAARRAAILARAAQDAATPPPRFTVFAGKRAAPWPAEDWATERLASLAAARIASADGAAHLMALALAGRAGDPFLAGSALHLLAAPAGFASPGGPGGLAAALEARARRAGAELRCGVEAIEIRRERRGATLVLADGSEIAAAAILSTLDFKQTFLSLFAWSSLPPALGARIGQYRMDGGAARLLLALDAPPDLPPFALRSPLHVMPDPQRLAAAHSACRAGLIPDHPPAVARFVSASDPGLAPAGKAVLAVTLGAIPHRLFDGGWTRDKRDLLKARALRDLEAVLPGLSPRVLASQLLVPPDMEAALGITAGDLMGGEIAADQMLGQRPWLDCAAPRTPLAGLYLAGGSTAAGLAASLASGAEAARAIIADKRAGRLP